MIKTIEDYIKENLSTSDQEIALDFVKYLRDKNLEFHKDEPLVYIGEELNSIHILGKAVAFQSVIR